MADVNASDYGMLDYGENFYSALPVWLAESESDIKFKVFGAIGFAHLLNAVINIEIGIESIDYIGPFWVPDIPPDNAWNDGSEPGDVWIPDVPLEITWSAEAEKSNVWISEPAGIGPWIPVGPDMTPNKGFRHG